MSVNPTFALGPPPPKDDPSFDAWETQMWKWIKYLSSNAGSGTVTSVAQTVPSILSVSGSPITTSGTLAISLANESANLVFSGPTTGADATPTFRSLVAADLPAGTGTVTSVAQTVPAEFSVAGSPITTSGTLAISKATQSANLVWAGPTTGAAAQPSFRSLVTADLPSGTGTVTTVSVTTANGVSGTVANATTTPAITLTLGAITPSSVTASGDVAVNGGSITTTQTTANIVNATATTVNFAGGATTALNMGSTSGTNTVSGTTKITRNASALPTAASGTVLQIANVDSTITGVQIDSFATAPQLLMRRSQGTAASPTAITSGQAMFNFGGGGRAATVFNNASMLIQASATENWSDTANGTQVTIATTPNGSTTRGIVATFGQDATLSLTNALTVPNGGTGATTLTGLLTGNGTSAVTAQTYTARTNWTPTLKFGGATTGITYGVQLGSYVQLAGVVYFTLNVTLTSKGSATGAATFTGLPVTSYASASQMYLVQGDGFADIAMAFLAGSSTTLALYSTATAAWTDANVSNDSVFRISGFYFA